MRISPKHKEKPTDFTRKRKIGFKGVLVSVLINLKHSLAVEIDNFIEKLDVDEDLQYTKQAYSKARQNLKPSAYVELNDIVLETLYESDYKTFKGYRIIAVDGSTVQLPNTNEMRQKYGVFSETKQNFPAGKICLTYDVMNEYILSGSLFSYKGSEKAAAMEMIPTLFPSKSQDILIFDRGFASVALLKMLNKENKKYIFRVQRRFLKEIDEFSTGLKDDETLRIDITERRIKTSRMKNIKEPLSFDLRCTRIPLEKEDEILITNLTKEEMNLEELKFLYSKRWGIETRYSIIKNALELENFTGDTDRAVQQDFYATIYISNLASAFISDAQEEYEKSPANEKKKYAYKVNKKIAMAYLKRDLLHVLLLDDPAEAKEQYAKFVNKLSKHVIPIRNDRSYARPIRHKPRFGRTNKSVL